MNYSPKQLFRQLTTVQNLILQLNAQRKKSICTRIFLVFLVGWLNWVGLISIYEISILSRYLVQSWTGHFVQALHIFKYSYLHKYNNLEFNPVISEFYGPLTIRNKIKQRNNICPDSVEYLPQNALPPRVNPIDVSCFIDSDHAGDKITHRSQYGIILNFNKSPIVWYYNRQATVESSTFDSELVPPWVALELNISVRYKLQMLIIPIWANAGVFCDNKAVYQKKVFANSTLKKEHNPIFCHCVI